MKKTVWPITCKGSVEDVYMISLPHMIWKQLPDPKQATLQIGTYTAQVSCMKNEEKADVNLSSKLLHLSGLPEGLHCHLTIEDDRLRLGPVIGVFVSKKYIRRLENQQPKQRTMELIRANEEAKTILYFFSGQDVKDPQKKILGTYFNTQTRRWEKSEFPYPDALYDRGSGNPRKLSFTKTAKNEIGEYANHSEIKCQPLFR